MYEPLPNIYLVTICVAVQIRDDVRDHPELYSQIYTPHPVVVPGGRFRELYYWLVSLHQIHTSIYTIISGTC